MAGQKLDLFEFASASMAEARAAATKIVRCQIAYAGLIGATFDRIPDYVGCHPSILSRSVLQNPSEHFPLLHARMAQPDIYKPLAPIRHRHRSNPSALALQIDNGPVALPQLQLIIAPGPRNRSYCQFCWDEQRIRKRLRSGVLSAAHPILQSLNIFSAPFVCHSNFTSSKIFLICE
jgi:hypothetical protein